MSHRKTTMIAVAAAFYMLAASRASAQAATQSDSVRRLATVTVTVAAKTAPKTALQIARENQRFTRELSAYDRRISQLESHLEHLRTVVADSLADEAARLDRAAAETRKRRLELEARLKRLERAGDRTEAGEGDGIR